MKSIWKALRGGACREAAWCKNMAKHNEGGGLALAAPLVSYAYIAGGTFKENKTEADASWGGGGIFCGQYSYLVFPNGAAMTSNTADGFGAGLAGCSTGTLMFDGSVIMAGNTAKGIKPSGNSNGGFSNEEKKTDRSYANLIPVENAKDYFSCLKSFVSGQFKSGSDTTLTGADWSGYVDGNTVSGINSGVLSASEVMALTSKLSSDQIKQITATYPVKIHGNTSSKHGGGVLVNGTMIGGDTQDMFYGDALEIKAEKRITGTTDNDYLKNHSFTFVLSDQEPGTEGANIFGKAKTDNTGNIQFDPFVPHMVENLNQPSLLDVAGKKYQFPLTLYLYEETPQIQDSSVIYDSTVYQLQISGTVEEHTYFIQHPAYIDAQGGIHTGGTTTVTEHKVAFTQDNLKLFKSTGENTASPQNGLKYAYTQIDSGFTASITEKQVNSSDDGAERKYIKVLNVSLGNALSFINRVPPKKTIEVKKVWLNQFCEAMSNPLNDSVTVVLNKKEAGGSWEPVLNASRKPETLELSKSNDWSGRWENLPCYDASARPVEYGVEEINPDIRVTSTAELIQSKIPGSPIRTLSGTGYIAEKSLVIQDQEIYMIASRTAGKVLGSADNPASGWWVNSQYSTDLQTLEDSVLAEQFQTEVYEESSGYLFKAHLHQNGTFKLEVVDRQSLRGTGVYLDHWVQGQSGDYSDLGFYGDGNDLRIQNGRVEIQSGKSSSEWLPLTFENSSFGTSTYPKGEVTLLHRQTWNYETSGTDQYLDSWKVTNQMKAEYPVGVKIHKIKKKENAAERDESLPEAYFQILKKKEGSEEPAVLRFEFNSATGSYQISDDNSPTNPENSPYKDDPDLKDLDPMTVLTTDREGLISITALDPGDYILKEVKAPNGYELLAEGIPFTISTDPGQSAPSGSPDSLTELTYNSETNLLNITVSNTLKSFTLPQAGYGGGIKPWILGGLTVSLLAMGAAVIDPRKKNGKNRSSA